MRHIRSRSGFTLIEAIFAMGIMTTIVAATAAMWVATMRSYDTASARTYTDMDAVTALQMIVKDVREAKDFKLIANSTRLRVILPVINDDHSYNRFDADMANQIDYYLSDETGVPGHKGTCLWKGKNNNNRQLLRRNVCGLEFVPDTQQSIRITVITENRTYRGPQRTKLTQRVVYLRNH